MNNIVGNWSLCEIRVEHSSGETVYPLGREVCGVLLYNQQGYMSGIFASMERLCIGSLALFGVDAEKRMALSEGFNAYAGSYRVIGNKICHNIKVSFVPDLMKLGEHAVHYVFEQNKLLLLRTVYNATGKSRSMVRLEWERMEECKNDKIQKNYKTFGKSLL